MKKHIIIQVVISIVLMGVYLSIWNEVNSPANDSIGYLNETNRLLNHQPVSSIERPPGYPLFLAGVFAVAGVNNWHFNISFDLKSDNLPVSGLTYITNYKIL
jgi:hypothetical protein